MINVFYFMIYLRFLSYKGRKVKLIKGSRISGGPDRCRHHPESSSYNIGVVPKSFE